MRSVRKVKGAPRSSARTRRLVGAIVGLIWLAVAIAIVAIYADRDSLSSGGGALIALVILAGVIVMIVAIVRIATGADRRPPRRR